MKKSFAKELAELINRHSIDAKMNTNDWILADVAVDALNAYGKANQLRERMANAPETEKDDCNCSACQMRRALTEIKSLVVGGRIHEKELERILNQKTGGVRRSKGGESNG